MRKAKSSVQYSSIVLANTSTVCPDATFSLPTHAAARVEQILIALSTAAGAQTNFEERIGVVSVVIVLLRRPPPPPRVRRKLVRSICYVCNASLARSLTRSVGQSVGLTACSLAHLPRSIGWHFFSLPPPAIPANGRMDGRTGMMLAPRKCSMRIAASTSLTCAL